MIRLLRLLLLAVGASLLSGVPAVASTGVSIDVGSIAIKEELAPGGEYRLPTFGVRNPGTEDTSYVIVVSYLDGQDALRPAADWFTFSPATLTLHGGGSQAVNTSLEIPPDAAPGAYAALVGPQVVGQGGGAQVGAGAAARLTFTVAEGGGIDAWLRRLGRFLSDNPWVWIGALLILLIAATIVIRRRFRFTITSRS